MRDSNADVEIEIPPPPKREKPPVPERKSSVRDESVLRGESELLFIINDKIEGTSFNRDVGVNIIAIIEV